MSTETPPSDPPSLQGDALNVARGALIGSVDVIPGVSGGTMAFILGIYDRLITAISRFDFETLSLIRQGEWSKAGERIDLRFLASLGLGIAIGIVCIGTLLNTLVRDDVTRPWVQAALFGIIGATGIMVARMVRCEPGSQTWQAWALGVAGLIFAWWLCGLSSGHVTPSYGYLFICGAVAICAMILPGISGAMMLWVFGIYVHLTDILHDVAHGKITGDALLTILVFGLGCALGLGVFSRMLKWLLKNFEWQTVACMSGIIFGSMRKLWPFQKDLTETVTDFKLKEFENVWPEFNGLTFGLIATAIVAGIVTLAIDTAIRHYFHTPAASPDPTGEVDFDRLEESEPQDLVRH